MALFGRDIGVIDALCVSGVGCGDDLDWNDDQPRLNDYAVIMSSLRDMFILLGQMRVCYRTGSDLCLNQISINTLINAL